jgi:hypothetical protein
VGVHVIYNTHRGAVSNLGILSTHNNNFNKQHRPITELAITNYFPSLSATDGPACKGARMALHNMTAKQMLQEASKCLPR